MSALSFDSLESMLTAVDARAAEVRGGLSDGRPTAALSSKASHTWDLGLGFDGAVRLAREGWPEGREMFRAGMATIEGAGTLDRLQTIRDVAGSTPCVGAALAGHPRSMYRLRREPVQARVVTVYIDCAASGGIPASTLLNRGIAIASWVDAQENSGVRVELFIMDTGRAGVDRVAQARGAPMTLASLEQNPASQHVSTVRIKGAGEALDIDRAAFLIGHPATFRRLMFATAELDVPYIKVAGYGYGTPSTFRPDEPDAIVLRSVRTEHAQGFATAASAAATINAEIARQQKQGGDE